MCLPYSSRRAAVAAAIGIDCLSRECTVEVALVAEAAPSCSHNRCCCTDSIAADSCTVAVDSCIAAAVADIAAVAAGMRRSRSNIVGEAAEVAAEGSPHQHHRAGGG